MQLMPKSCDRWVQRVTRPVPLVLVLVCAGLLSTTPARADTAAPGMPKPRAAFVVGGLEMVLVLAKDRLYAFVDGLDDNAPASVDGLEVAAGTRKWDMVGAGPGLYVAAPFVLPPGHQDLTVDVVTAAGEKHVATALDIDRSVAVAGTGGGGWLAWLWWLVTAAAIVALVAVLAGRRVGAGFLRSLGRAG